jgi:hypothetical protein
MHSTSALRCVVCQQPFLFEAGVSALILRHAAYGYDFVHDDPCLAAALERIFPEPGYDCAAFGRDRQRRRVLGVAPAEGCIAVLARVPEATVVGLGVHTEPLLCWALVEHQDGTTYIEGVVRDVEWLDEPGGAEFPEALRGPQTLLGYASPTSSLRFAERRAA